MTVLEENNPTVTIHTEYNLSQVEVKGLVTSKILGYQLFNPFTAYDNSQ